MYVHTTLYFLHSGVVHLLLYLLLGSYFVMLFFKNVFEFHFSNYLLLFYGNAINFCVYFISQQSYNFNNLPVAILAFLGTQSHLCE